MASLNPSSSAHGRDEVSIAIDGKEFRGWNSVSLTLSMDSYPTVAFKAPFEVERMEFRKTFLPFSYKPVDVFIGGERKFHGTLMPVTPEVSSESRVIGVSAYAKCAVLTDSDLPASMLPFEVNGLTLRQIAERVGNAFGFGVILRGRDSPKFLRTKCRRDGDAQSFLADLSKLRGDLLTANEDGDLVIQQAATTGKPVARLRQGEPPLTSVSPQFNTQDYYSEITAYVPSRGGRIGSKYTLQNPRLQGVLRAHSFSLHASQKGDAPLAAAAKMSRMFANMVTYTVTAPTWRDANGDLWEPNRKITLLAPDAMVYRESELLIRNVTLDQEGDKTASLDLVLSGSFTGEAPERMPWED